MKISDAALSYQYFIKQVLKDRSIFSNYGIILNSLGKLEEAELSQYKAIELKPDFAEPHYNLGIILKDTYKLREVFTRNYTLYEKLSMMICIKVIL